MYPKRQLVDAALALALSRISKTTLAGDPTLAGRYFESFVTAQIRTEVDAVKGELFHLRTKAGQREVDCLIEIEGEILAVEIKFGTQPTSNDARHLLWLQEQLGGSNVGWGRIASRQGHLQPRG